MTQVYCSKIKFTIHNIVLREPVDLSSKGNEGASFTIFKFNQIENIMGSFDGTGW